MGSGIALDLEYPEAYLRPRLSVYLACSLSSDENRPFKDELLCNTARIFTEQGFRVHNPGIHTPPGSPHPPSEVYFEDLFHTINADFIFFLRLGRSHGMGIEAQLGADVLLPWGDARANDSYTLSPLLAGLANAPAVFRATVTADDPSEFYRRLVEFLRDENRLERLRGARHARDSAHALIHDWRFGYHVRVHRLLFGLRTTALGDLTDIDPTWIEAIESDSRFVSKLTLTQFARLCDALEMTFTRMNREPAPSLPEFAAPARVSPALLEAARTFAGYSLGSGSPSTRRPMDDTCLLSQWKEWLAAKNLRIIERIRVPLATSGEPIRVYLCPPLSNVLAAERERLDVLVRQLKASLEGSGVAVQVDTPALQKTNRDDHGAAIYQHRVAELMRTDLAITILDPPSTGVGVMLQLFHNGTIPCLCATRSWAKVSRMVRGLAPFKLSYIESSSPDVMCSEIADWLSRHADAIRQSRARREQAWQRLRGLNFHRAAVLARIVQGADSGLPLFRDEFLAQLSANQDMTAALTLLQVAHVVFAQKWRLIPSASDSLDFEPALEGLPSRIRNDKRAAAAARASLANLWDALETLGSEIDEIKIRGAWSTYLGELSVDAARGAKRVRTVGDLTRSVEQWLRVLRAKEEL